jgi:tetratricopeptide (TPR) repeat protein
MKKFLLLLFLFATVASSEESSLREYRRRAFTLSDAEVERIKEEIRTRCNLPQAQEATFPWYYHYEVGLAMEKHQDWQRALDSLFTALDRRGQPERFSRIYGMWFIDYRPYYHVGLAHYYLKNWKCAVDSFRLSQILEDIPSNTVESQRSRELAAEAEQQLQLLRK